MRLAEKMPYRTDEKHFGTMIPKRDFRGRGTIVFRDYCYRNQLEQADSGEDYSLEDPYFLGDPRL